jgi:hypothetical protein
MECVTGPFLVVGQDGVIIRVRQEVNKEREMIVEGRE